jgi:hypothetical protein
MTTLIASRPNPAAQIKIGDRVLALLWWRDGIACYRVDAAIS